MFNKKSTQLEAATFDISSNSCILAEHDISYLNINYCSTPKGFSVGSKYCRTILNGSGVIFTYNNTSELTYQWIELNLSTIIIQYY